MTGSSGFIGSRLKVELLNYERVRITEIVRKVSLGSTVDQLTYEDFFSLSKTTLNNFDVLIHLASLNNVDSEFNPLEAVEVNVKNSLKLFRKAEELGIGRFILLSTSQVYCSGNTDIVEESNVCNSNVYSTTHLMAEYLLSKLAIRSHCSLVTLRSSNSFGLSNSVNGTRPFVNSIVTEMVKTGSLTIKMSKDIMKNWITLHDLCCALRFCCETDRLDHVSLFNIGGSKNLSMCSMAVEIAEFYYNLTGNRIDTSYESSSLRIIDDTGYTYSSKKFENIGFQFSNNYNDELKRLIENEYR